MIDGLLQAISLKGAEQQQCWEQFFLDRHSPNQFFYPQFLQSWFFSQKPAVGVWGCRWTVLAPEHEHGTIVVFFYWTCVQTYKQIKLYNFNYQVNYQQVELSKEVKHSWFSYLGWLSAVVAGALPLWWLESKAASWFLARYTGNLWIKDLHEHKHTLPTVYISIILYTIENA